MLPGARQGEGAGQESASCLIAKECQWYHIGGCEGKGQTGDENFRVFGGQLLIQV